MLAAWHQHGLCNESSVRLCMSMRKGCLKDGVSPWWLKSKHPSTQMRSFDMGTSSCGSTGHWPGWGTTSCSGLDIIWVVYVICASYANMPLQIVSRGWLFISILASMTEERDYPLLGFRDVGWSRLGRVGRSLPSLGHGPTRLISSRMHLVVNLPFPTALTVDVHAAGIMQSLVC